MSWDHADTFREKLRRGKVCLGTVISLTDPTVTEALCPLFDFLWIDMEHSVLSLEAVQAHVMASRGSGAATLVRVPWNDPVLVKPVLDLGASGVIVPMVRTADDVRRAVAACLYPPEGIRGFGPRRPSQYGRLGGPEFCREANAKVLPVVQIEHIDAVENIDEILAVPGLASIAFGPNDLAGSMGLIGQPRHPNVLRAIDSVIARSRQANVPVGISVGEDPGNLVEWASRGVSWLAMGGDLSLMLRAATEVAGRVREQVAAFSGEGAMKITRIETLRLPEHPQSIWVHLHTSDGLVGLGETYHVPGAVEAVIHDYVAPLLLGQSAFDRERHWQTFFAYANFFGHAGAEMRALSALDIALWDLLGQHVGQPIYNLIGGRCRESIPIYNTCVNTPKYADQDAFLERPGELARSLLDQGIRQMKVWPWDRFAPQLRLAHDTGPAGWAAVGPPGNHLAPEDLQAGLWVVQEIRKAVGDRMQIAIEGHSRWDLNCALRIARALEPYDVVWMEDIIQPDSADDLARLVRESRVPQAVSERRMTRFAYRELLQRQAAHIVMLDVVWTGGITEALKIAALADTYHLPITPHDCTGPINVFAALHLCAAAQNVMIQETVRGFYEGYYLDLLTRPLPIREGRAGFDLGPGLGVKLRPDVLSRPDLRRRVSGVDS